MNFRVRHYLWLIVKVLKSRDELAGESGRSAKGGLPEPTINDKCIRGLSPISLPLTMSPACSWAAKLAK